MCELLVGRLADAALSAAAAGDRGACRDAARCAQEIGALMSGGQP